MCWDVAGDTRIRVLEPGAANVCIFLVDDMIHAVFELVLMLDLSNMSVRSFGALVGGYITL